LLVLVFTATEAYLAGNGLDVDRVFLSTTAYTVENSSVNNREIMYRGAWEQYLDSPLIGSSIVERGTLSYPHNLILEGFMATGTFGGVALVLLVLLASYRALRLIVHDTTSAWIPLCFFQQLIGAMFSGGIYGNMLLWGMTGIVLGADIPSQPWYSRGTRQTDRRVAPQALTQLL
jgi:O-antigen ligase